MAKGYEKQGQGTRDPLERTVMPQNKLQCGQAIRRSGAYIGSLRGGVLTKRKGGYKNRDGFAKRIARTRFTPDALFVVLPEHHADHDTLLALLSEEIAVDPYLFPRDPCVSYQKGAEDGQITRHHCPKPMCATP